jgi:hypothetical protein
MILAGAAAAAVVLATPLATTPAAAQVGFYAGPGGFDVQIGPRYRDYDRRYYRHGWNRGHHYGWYRDRYTYAEPRYYRYDDWD